MVWVLSRCQYAEWPQHHGEKEGKEFAEVGTRTRALDKPHGVLDTGPEGKMNLECLQKEAPWLGERSHSKRRLGTPGEE